jgi:hypothetical protein
MDGGEKVANVWSKVHERVCFVHLHAVRTLVPSTLGIHGTNLVRLHCQFHCLFNVFTALKQD